MDLRAKQSGDVLDETTGQPLPPCFWIWLSAHGKPKRWPMPRIRVFPSVQRF